MASVQPLQLHFSQDGATPSGQLASFVGGLCLNSQPMPPVPPFSEAGGPCCSQLASQQQDMVCSDEPLGTQDFITPADQFGVEGEPGNAAAQQRSPARLSPNRVKRPRHGPDEEVADGEAVSLGEPRQPAPSQQPVVKAVPRRARSPPCYRNIFKDEDESCFANWRAQRSWLGDSRYLLDFKEIGQLGQGSFSKVLRARHRINGQEYAVKRTTRELTPDNPAFVQFIQEAQVLARLPPHSNIVGYYGSWTERGPGGGEFLYHQLEKCEVSLGGLASLGEALREPDLLEVLRQMCLALVHLHSHGIAHLDVKPDNIYTWGEFEGERDMPRVYKLGDFGQATRFDCRQAMNVIEGDSRYLPLEVMNSDYSRLDKADMFALGATMFELASRSELPSSGQLYQDLRCGKVPLLPNITTSFLKLIKSLLSQNPGDRPSAEKVLASSVLNKKGSPGLVSQGSTASALSAQSAEGKYGGLVLQRSVHS
ncbi:hypothetical protein N2152v2_002036 [Parachlorella kessleri]